MAILYMSYKLFLFVVVDRFAYVSAIRASISG